MSSAKSKQGEFLDFDRSCQLDEVFPHFYYLLVKFNASD